MRLAELILDLKILSEAQIELALADQETTDLPLEEVLVARGWLTKEELYGIAPWLKRADKSTPASATTLRPQKIVPQQSTKTRIPQEAASKSSKQLDPPAKASPNNYAKNLAAYKELIKKTLGKGYE